MSFVHTFHGVVGRRIILYEQELEHIMAQGVVNT